MSMTPPATLEICQREFNAGRCHGIISRPQPDLIMCGRCGGKEAGQVYVLRSADDDVIRDLVAAIGPHTPACAICKKMLRRHAPRITVAKVASLPGQRK